MPREVPGAKIACLDFSLQKAKMQLGVQVVIDDPEKLGAIRERSALTRSRLCLLTSMHVVLVSLVYGPVCLSFSEVADL